MKIRSKAVERGVITIDQAARLGDHEAARLVFLPGFSTAETVSNISGRGVGMDVVKTNIEKIGGQVDIQSKVGEGTVLRSRSPSRWRSSRPSSSPVAAPSATRFLR